MKTLLVTNIKGGVAKSSTAVAIATGLKLLKPDSKVLLIDGDPQGSIKTYFGLKLQNSDKDFTSFLIEDTPFEDAIQKGVARIAKTVKNVQGAWVKEQKVGITDGKISKYHVIMIVSFVINEDSDVG